MQFVRNKLLMKLWYSMLFLVSKSLMSSRGLHRILNLLHFCHDNMFWHGGGVMDHKLVETSHQKFMCRDHLQNTPIYHGASCVPSLGFRWSRLLCTFACRSANALSLQSKRKLSNEVLKANSFLDDYIWTFQKTSVWRVNYGAHCPLPWHHWWSTTKRPLKSCYGAYSACLAILGEKRKRSVEHGRFALRNVKKISNGIEEHSYKAKSRRDLSAKEEQV